MAELSCNLNPHVPYESNCSKKYIYDDWIFGFISGYSETYQGVFGSYTEGQSRHLRPSCPQLYPFARCRVPHEHHAKNTWCTFLTEGRPTRKILSRSKPDWWLHDSQSWKVIGWVWCNDEAKAVKRNHAKFLSTSCQLFLSHANSGCWGKEVSGYYFIAEEMSRPISWLNLV